MTELSNDLLLFCPYAGNWSTSGAAQKVRILGIIVAHMERRQQPSVTESSFSSAWAGCLGGVSEPEKMSNMTQDDMDQCILHCGTDAIM